jgi:hypothetical protein
MILVRDSIMSLNRKQEGAISFMPTEIISQILSDDCLEAADLCRLSVTNKRLMQALQPILYNHIVLLSDQLMAVERLLRSLNENAHLRALLRHLRLRSTPTCGWVAFPQSINLAFERILGFHLPALESLILEMAKIDINVYKINPTLPVRSIFINHASVEQAVMLLLLPHIEKIHIACIDDTDQLFYALDDHSISHFIPPKKSRFSTVRHIRIDQGFGPHTSLSPFIEWPRELQSLHISINTVNGLSPISVDNHLEPVRETLQDLSIVAYTNNVTFDNATFIHFEGFKHLAHLKITSSLLFRSTWNFATIERTGIFRHLAISLETLTVALSTKQYPFHNVYTYRTIGFL